jgi:teichuronic acid biosynthesis glycosyltransferase TuaG
MPLPTNGEAESAFGRSFAPQAETLASANGVVTSATSPTCSIVITCYNNAGVIADAIRSVRAQTFRDWELLVVDDHSSDNTVAILDQVLEGVPCARLIRLATNSGGPATPRNVGVAASRGRYIAFLDADDIWHPIKLELQLEAVRQAGVEFISTRVTFFRDATKVRFAENALGRESDLQWSKIDHRRLLRKNILWTSTVLAARDCLLANPFIVARKYRAIEDYRCWLDVHRTKIRFSARMAAPLAYYRLADTSISRNKTEMVRKNLMLYRDYLPPGPLKPLRVLWYMCTYALLASVRNLRRLATPTG